MTSSSFENIVLQWENMLNSGKIPCFEFELKNDEYLLVNLELNETNKEIQFSFDSMNLKTWFSGNVKQYHDCLFALPIDDYCENVDQVLEVIYEEVNEGFIIPNRLFKTD